MSAPSRVHRATAPAMQSISPQLLAQTAINLLPSTAKITDLHGRATAGDVMAEFVYDDGNGAAQIEVSMGFRQDGADGVDDSCNPNDPLYPQTCSTTQDGSHVGTFVAMRGTTQYSVYVVRPDHVEVSMTAFNAPQEKDAAPSRPARPFTLARLTTFVSDPTWTPWVSPADNQAAANLFVPDYVYDARAQRNQRRLEAQLAAQAQERRAEHRKADH